MAIIKCKMCGGDIELTADKTFGTCEYCGSTMTLPKINDEQRAAAFNRGNHFRRTGEFDKALAVYERIVAEDDADAEAHWCCALCRFGIEYVEDPATYEWLPTCHRASFDSFLEDVDYLAAVEHSDGITRRQYQRDAMKIAEVQRGILATSQNEEPFDVFICYKETDANGNRTVDSTLAQDIYYQLTESGYRVFFSRITLEDKGGAEYEPYIFAALNSAKVMVALGTKPEYFNAVWVKNEWSRFLAMMRSDRSKLLLPCYRDMDPYDLPEQLSVLQSYDMSKIGFVQDLLRGIKKVLDADKKPEPVKETVVVQQSAASNNIVALLKRGNMALEDGDWGKADGFFEEVLNQDAECAEAYLGKTLAAERCATLNALVKKRLARTESAEYRNFALSTNPQRANTSVEKYFIPSYLSKETIKEFYTHKPSYANCIDSRKAQKAEEERWWSEHKQLSRAVRFATGDVAQSIKSAYAELMKKFDERIAAAEAESAENKAAGEKKYSDFLDAADVKAAKQYETAFANREKDYQDLCRRLEKDSDAAEYESIAKDFEKLLDYKDSKERLEICKRKAAEWRANLEAEKERRRIQEEQELAKKKAKTKKISKIAAVIAAVIIVAVLLTTMVIIPNGKYNDAMTLMESGKYEEAANMFGTMGGFKDAREKSYELWADITERETVSAGDDHTVGLKSDGTVVAVGDNYYGQCDVSGWTDIVAVSAGHDHTVGLKSDGTVVAVGDNYYGQCDVSDWTDIVAVSAGDYHTVGLKSDGTVVAVGKKGDGQCDVSGWTDIVAVSAGDDHTVGLKSDGTVVAVGKNVYGQCDVSGWTDIVAVSAGDDHTVGLKSDGTVVAVGKNVDGRCDVSGWTDIVAVSAGGRHTVGLKSDGTVVAVGYNNDGRCDVSGWTDIVAVSAGGRHTVGLKSGGIVVAVGSNGAGQRDVNGWQLFDN